MKRETANATPCGKRGRKRSEWAGYAAKPSLYDEVMARIIAGRKGRLGLPKNALTGRTYSGDNILILCHHVVRAASRRKSGSPTGKRRNWAATS